MPFGVGVIIAALTSVLIRYMVLADWAIAAAVGLPFGIGVGALVALNQSGGWSRKGHGLILFLWLAGTQTASTLGVGAIPNLNKDWRFVLSLMVLGISLAAYVLGSLSVLLVEARRPDRM